MIDEYDEFSQSYEGDGTDSAASEELNRMLTESELDELDSCLLNMENMDKKPAANIDPIKDTPYLNTTSYLWMIIDGSVSCQLVVHFLLDEVFFQR